MSQGKVKPCSLAKDEAGLCGTHVIREGRERSPRLTLEVEPWVVVGGPERAVYSHLNGDASYHFWSAGCGAGSTRVFSPQTYHQA